MRYRYLPAPPLVWSVATGVPLSLILLLAGLPSGALLGWTLAALALLALLAAADALVSVRQWRASQVQLSRQLPHVFAVGVRCTIPLRLTSDSRRRWRLWLHDHPGERMRCEAQPARLEIVPGRSTELRYFGTPTQRGELHFAPAQARVRTVLGLGLLDLRIGAAETRRVFPDFAQIARYAWLAGDRRLSELGIKTWRQRGAGTDFKQLTDYRPGDELRRIDWKATLRSGRAIVREYQDERDQCVLLLLDCGRRMRAEEDGAASHFDAALNAAALLAHVALDSGDAVGAQTFAVPTGSERFIPPAKGLHSLAGLVAGLYDQQPTLSHPDYLQAATETLRRLRRRSLVVLLTNFRDEDSEELRTALRLLRSRHMVLLASLREPVLREMAAQPLHTAEDAIEVAGAHLFSQSRAAAFARLATRDALMVDAEPQRLAVELVNRYRAAKRAGVL